MNPHTPYPDENQDPSSPAHGSGSSAIPPSGPETPDAGTLPPPPPYYGATPVPGAARSQSFFEWVRSQRISRGRDRWVGGVASGVAHRLGVDPLIVRGIFIVLAIFAGVGVLLYGLAWALLPEPDGRIHVQEAGAGRWSGGMTGALITTLIGLPGLGSGVWGWDRHGFGGFVWTAFWLIGIGYLVYYLIRRNKTPDGAQAFTATFAGAPQAGTPYPSTPYASTPQAGTPYASTPKAGTEQGPGWAATPPSGPTSPSGNPYRPVPPPKPRNLGPGAPAVAVTAGAALLVGGGLKAVDTANVLDLGTSSNAIVWASAAAVLGLGILFAGLRGRTSGILGFLAVVALIVGSIFNVIPNGDRFRFQNADWSPASIEQARNGFEITGGRGTVDLTQLALTPPLTSDVAVPLDITASSVTVVIPQSVPVQVQTDMTMGNLSEGGRSHGGMTTQQNDYNTGQPGARLVLRISGTFSSVTIQEGN